MQYLRIKTLKSRLNKHGKPHVVIILNKKLHRHSKRRKETNISKKKNLIIACDNFLGSRYTKRIYDKADLIWNHARVKGKIYLDSSKPLTEWYYQPQVIKHFEDTRNLKWRSLLAHEKANFLEIYVKETNAVVIINGACSLSGRKLSIAEDCVQVSRRFVLSATSENEIKTGLRTYVLFTDPEIIRLSSDHTTDKTNIVLIVVALGFLSTGNLQIGAFIFLLRFFMFMPGGNRKN